MVNLIFLLALSILIRQLLISPFGDVRSTIPLVQIKALTLPSEPRFLEQSLIQLNLDL